MSLQNATLEQLFGWQSDIVKEICRRAALGPVAQTPRAPWETQTVQMVPQHQQAAPQVQRPPPGTVLTTARTDPDLAARFAQVAPRFEGVPGLQGNGRGEGGVAELSTTG